MVISTVTGSAKYQIVIPQDVTERIKLKPGQKVVVEEKDGAIHLIPQKPIRGIRSFLKEIATNHLRDEENRF